ncbi:MAG: Crp/Fnr family transcriptional regulator [Bdellovibrio sp.]
MKENATEKCPICSSQEEKITEQIVKILQSKKYSKNSIIFDQEQPCSGLYLIKSGAVKISKLSPDGKEMLIEILHAGNTLGEAGLLGQEKHSDTATTTEESEVFFLPKQEFQIILMKHPELYQSVVQSLIRWMDKLHLVIENISLSSARGRVLGYISRLEKEQNNSIIRLSAKKHEVALMLGLRPETFSRTLTELESEGLIKLDHKQIHILQKA